MTVQFGWSLQARGALADREAISTLARRAEALGYDSIWVTDRLVIPETPTKEYPYSPTGAFPLGPDEPWLEALTAVTYLATITERIQVGTSVLVIPYRNPVYTARALATADYLSGGRIILGAGIGWWREEFAVVGASFEDRAARTLEALRLMKAMWTERRLEWPPVGAVGGLRPQPAETRASGRRGAGGRDGARHPTPHIPIWIGGHSEAALRRVVAVADGWHPLGLRPPVALHPPELTAKVRQLHDLARAAGRDPAGITVAFKAPLRFDDAAGPTRPPLTGSPTQIGEDLRAYVAAGVEHFVLDFSVPTVPAMLEVLERFAGEVREKARA
jgi:alkanesulfonate monooxygenase SsuD/methylene tetrahydromethanopterin reductase-like flavin-dependent oxidoreductase (luciferase family)